MLGARPLLEISRFAFVSEAVLAFWLLINGIRGTCPQRTTLSQPKLPSCVHGLRVFGVRLLLGTSVDEFDFWVDLILSTPPRP